MPATKAKQLYELTDEHRAQLAPWRDKWIANAMSTAPMTDEDRARAREAVKGLYRAASLEPPPDERIVFVSSPFVLRFAAGFAAAIWHLRKHAPYLSTEDATEDATRAATEAATEAATRADLWHTDLRATMRAAAMAIGGPTHARLLLSCAVESYRMWNGGNQWSGYSAYLSFFRHVAKLAIDYSKWDHYETLALVSGPRVMHEKFAMVSDRPVLLTVDAQNRPHCDDGPFCRWRDGTAIYSIHGVRVPRSVVEHPESLTVARIDSEANDEVRRIMVDRYGSGRFLRDSGATRVQADEYGTLYERRFSSGQPAVFVHLINSTAEADGTRREFWRRVHPELRPLLGDGRIGEPQARTARNAVASTYGLRGEQYAPMEQT